MLFRYTKQNTIVSCYLKLQLPKFPWNVELKSILFGELNYLESPLSLNRRLAVILFSLMFVVPQIYVIQL